MRNPYYTNEDLESLIDDLENETENSMKVALKTILLMLKEIRDNQLKKMNMRDNVHTQPTDNRNDIIVGLCGKDVINKDELETLFESKSCDGCEDCTCGDKKPKENFDKDTFNVMSDAKTGIKEIKGYDIKLHRNESGKVIQDGDKEAQDVVDGKCNCPICRSSK